MKRNFRYITKFEAETRSAMQTRAIGTLERRDNAYKSVVNSYFENVGIYYENDEVNIIDDRNATTKVPQTIGGWQQGWNSKKFEVPVGLPCRPARNVALSNSGDGQQGWWLDHTAPKVKAFIKKVIAMQVEHPEFEKNSSSARLEKRGYGLKATDVIGYAWEGELLTVEFVKHLFKTKQVEFDADSLKGRKDMNGIPEGLTANGEEYMPIFGSTELDESDRKMLEEGRSSSARLETRKWAKAGEMDEVGARELYLFADNESALQNQQKSIITLLASKFAKGAYDKDLAIKLWTHLADSASKLYSNANGGQFTPATRRETARMMEELHFPSVQDEAIDYKKRSSSARLETRINPKLKKYFEVFHISGKDSAQKQEDGTPYEEGWYYNWIGNDALFGAFKSSGEAWKNASQDFEESFGNEDMERSSSAQLEKRGFFGGDDEDEGKPMLRRKDFLRQVQQIIENDNSMDDNIYEVTREHAKNGKSKPQFNNDFFELFEQLCKEATKQVLAEAKQDGMSINDDDGYPLETTTDEEIRLFGNIGYPTMIDGEWKSALKEAEED